ACGRLIIRRSWVRAPPAPPVVSYPATTSRGPMRRAMPHTHLVTQSNCRLPGHHYVRSGAPRPSSTGPRVRSHGGGAAGPGEQQLGGIGQLRDQGQVLDALAQDLVDCGGGLPVLHAGQKERIPVPYELPDGRPEGRALVVRLHHGWSEAGPESGVAIVCFTAS